MPPKKKLNKKPWLDFIVCAATCGVMYAWMGVSIYRGEAVSSALFGIAGTLWLMICGGTWALWWLNRELDKDIEDWARMNALLERLRKELPWHEAPKQLSNEKSRHN